MNDWIHGGWKKKWNEQEQATSKGQLESQKNIERIKLYEELEWII